MNKTMSMCICMSEEEFEKLKKAVKLEKYSLYNKFMSRTVIKEPTIVVAENMEKEE